MTPASRVRLGSSFWVHVVGVAIAAAPAAMLGGFLHGETRAPGADRADSDSVIEALLAISHGRAEEGLVALALALAVAVIAQAPVQMAWLHALAGAPSPIAAGVRRTPAALAVSLLVFGFGAVVSAASLCPALAVHLALRGEENVRVHDIAVAVFASPLFLALFAIAFAHDLARSAIATGHAHPLAAFGAALRALRPRLGLELAAYLASAAAITVCALAATTFGGTDARAAVGVATAHLLLFARTWLRATWLERCLEATAPARPVEAPEDAGPALVQSARLTG